LIDEVLFETTVPGEQIRDEAVREPMLLVKQTNHLRFGDDTDPTRGYGCCRVDANRLPGQGPFTKEVAAAQHPHDRLSARWGDHGQLHRSLLNVEESVGRVTLRVDSLAWSMVHDLSCHPRRMQECVRIKRALFPRVRLDHLVHDFEHADGRWAGSNRHTSQHV